MAEDSQGVLQEKPEMHQLLYLEGEGDTPAVRVITEVKSKWEKLAHSLKFNAGIIAGVEVDKRGDCERACMEIFTRWLKGDPDTRQPVTWNTLIQTLRATDSSFEPLIRQLIYTLLHQN